MTDPEHLDWLESQGQDQIERESFGHRETHRVLMPGIVSGEAVWLITHDPTCIRVSCSGLNGLSFESAESLANAILIAVETERRKADGTDL
jgi:hypothetical protein